MKDKHCNTRTEILLGENYLEILQQKTVAIFGLGGVGGAVIEILARAGVEKFVLIDFDSFDITNLNRQILSKHDNLGGLKTEAAKERILSINPNAHIILHNLFFDETSWDLIFESAEKIDFVVDAIDSVSSKFFLIKSCLEKDIPIISSMGAGNRLNPEAVKITDISKTSQCGLARAIRTRLRQAKITKKLPVVCSSETPSFFEHLAFSSEEQKVTIGSIAYMPNLFGIFIAKFAIFRLLNRKN